MIFPPHFSPPWCLGVLAVTFLLTLGMQPVQADNAKRLEAESRRYSDMIASSPTKAGKKAAAEKSLELARKAVAADPADGNAHVTLAVALGKMTDFTDSRTKMEYARLIRQEAETGLKLDPKSDFACLILGKWHDEMSRLNPVLKAIATTIFGELPDASPVEAEKYFRRATTLDSEQMRHHAELAAFLERKDRKQEALVEWKKVVLLSPKDAEDREFVAAANKAVGE